jgi:hypothetical protein
MTPQHLHTPLVWFSGRADCVPWCVRGMAAWADYGKDDWQNVADHATTGV